MPIKVRKSRENDLVFKIFNEAIPPGLKAKLITVQQAPEQPSVAATLATGVTGIVKETAANGAVKLLAGLVNYGIDWYTKEPDSVTYPDLDYLKEETAYALHTDQDVANLTAQIHQTAFEYQKQKMGRWVGSNAKEGEITDHRYLIVALIEYVNKFIAEASDENERKLYAEFLKNFAAGIQRHEKEARRNPNQPGQIFLLKSSSSGKGSLTLRDALRLVNGNLYKYLGDDERHNINKQLKNLLENIPNALDAAVNKFDHELLELTTGLNNIPKNIIAVALGADAALKVNDAYEDILNGNYATYINKLFVTPRVAAAHLKEFHESTDAAGRLRVIDKQLGEVTAQQVSEFLKVIPHKTFPYFQEFQAEAADKLAQLLSVRNKLLKILFYLEELKKLAQLGGVLAVIFSKQTVKILFEEYKRTLADLLSARESFFDFCEKIHVEAVKYLAESAGITGFIAKNVTAQAGYLESWFEQFSLTDRSSFEDELVKLAQQANLTNLNLSQVEQGQLDQKIKAILDTISCGLTDVLKVNVPMSPTPVIQSPNRDLTASLSLSFVMVGDTQQEENRKKHTKFLESELFHAYERTDEAIARKIDAEQRCEAAEEKLQYVLTGKTSKGGDANKLHVPIFEQQKAIVAENEKVIQKQAKQLQEAQQERDFWAKQTIDTLFGGYKLPDPVCRKVNELIEAENAKLSTENDWPAAAAENMLVDDASEESRSDTTSKPQPIDRFATIELLGKCNMILRALGNAFMSFTHEYAARIDQGYSGFFHARHADFGRGVAKNQQDTWGPIAGAIVNKAFEAIQNLSQQEIRIKLIAAVDALLEQAKKQLREQQTGNLHRHSLKTYLIAYCEMLETVKSEFIDSKSIAVFYNANKADKKRDRLFDTYYTDKVQDGGNLSNRDYRQSEYDRLTKQAVEEVLVPSNQQSMQSLIQ